jgi:PAS domain S-box-containing protein
MGLVSLLSSEANAFSDTDIAFVEQVGQMLSLGISRVGDLERLEARTDALTESEERFRKVFEEGPLGMVLVSPDLQLMAANEAFCRMVGYTEPELIERALAELTHLEDAAGDAERMRELMAGEIPVYETEKRYVNGDGSTLWADQVASTVRDRDDRIAYGLVIVQDITDRRRTEQELVRLERLRALGELAAGVSHNLNNMLTGILGPAQLVKHLTDDPMVLREADIIINSSKRAADLVHRLNLSVRGKDDGEVSAVSVNELVESVIDETRPRWKDEPESRGVHIDVATDLRDVPPVRGTPSKLHDVLVNVLFNAVDAMPEGGTVTLSTRPDGAFVEVGVRDTGVGMDEETRRRVFEPFFTTKMDVGTGLGLSTVYGTITRSGGTAQVESTPGEGTAFSFRLPVWDDAPPEC